MPAPRILARLNGWVVESFARRTVPVAAASGVASFTFDDFPRSAATNAAPILLAFDARGTYYAAPGLMGIRNELGPHFTARDLDELAAQGHEIGSHTFSHISCRRTSAAAFAEDVSRGSAAIAGFTRGAAQNFSYPFGHVTVGAKRRIGRLMRSCRSTRAGINAVTADLNALRANRLYGWCFDLGAVRNLVQETRERGAWVIFYTHDVQSHPSQYGCTPAQFEAVVSLCRDEGLRIATVADALDSFAPLQDASVQCHTTSR